MRNDRIFVNLIRMEVVETISSSEDHFSGFQFLANKFFKLLSLQSIMLIEYCKFFCALIKFCHTIDGAHPNVVVVINQYSARHIAWKTIFHTKHREDIVSWIEGGNAFVCSHPQQAPVILCHSMNI